MLVVQILTICVYLRSYPVHPKILDIQTIQTPFPDTAVKLGKVIFTLNLAKIQDN